MKDPVGLGYGDEPFLSFFLIVGDIGLYAYFDGGEGDFLEY